jgi:deoxyguanosine kinase
MTGHTPVTIKKNNISCTDIENPEPIQHKPRYITVEGPIGVGKTSLARKLANTFNYQTILEKGEENPFLARFYANQPRMALPTQLFFLFQRSQQIQEMKQNDMFEPVRVADFLMEKDQLFAKLTLDEDEYALYEKVFNHLTINAPIPDLVIYLQAPVDLLLQRIRIRGIIEEQQISATYLEKLSQAYTDFFHYYDKSALLMINCSEVDFVNREDHYELLLRHILKAKVGSRQYLNFTSSLL